jgi:hypothetical protein
MHMHEYIFSLFQKLIYNYAKDVVFVNKFKKSRK